MPVSPYEVWGLCTTSFQRGACQVVDEHETFVVSMIMTS